VAVSSHATGCSPRHITAALTRCMYCLVTDGDKLTCNETQTRERQPPSIIGWLLLQLCAVHALPGQHGDCKGLECTPFSNRLLPMAGHGSCGAR
jgi:hypothetical protein